MDWGRIREDWERTEEGLGEDWRGPSSGRAGGSFKIPARLHLKGAASREYQKLNFLLLKQGEICVEVEAFLSQVERLFARLEVLLVRGFSRHLEGILPCTEDTCRYVVNEVEVEGVEAFIVVALGVREVGGIASRYYVGDVNRTIFLVLNTCELCINGNHTSLVHSEEHTIFIVDEGSEQVTTGVLIALADVARDLAFEEVT